MKELSPLVSKGLPGTAVGARLGLTQSAVSRAVRRGARLAKGQGLVFPEG